MQSSPIAGVKIATSRIALVSIYTQRQRPGTFGLCASTAGIALVVIGLASCVGLTRRRECYGLQHIIADFV